MGDELKTTLSRRYHTDIYETAVKVYDTVERKNTLRKSLWYSLHREFNVVYTPFIDLLFNALHNSENKDSFCCSMLEACIDSFTSQKLLLNVLQFAYDLLIVELFG